MINPGEFLRYLVVGVVNTVVGFGTIFLLMYLGLNPVYSNIVGYATGISLSFFLNRRFTFRVKTEKTLFQFIKFLAVLLISYLANITILIVAIYKLKMNPYFSQVVSGIVYTASGFLLTKKFVFKS